MFRKHLVAAIIILSGAVISADDIHLEFLMPGDMFGPGSTFSVDLAVENTGNAYNAAQLFVALTVGTSDFWFYPSWVQFPPNIDWETVFVPSNSSDQWMILPEFLWPDGAGSFDGAMFLAAIIHNGVLVSNLADVTFGWSKYPPPTPTPTPPPGFAYISPGTYTRGSPEDEPCRSLMEGPQHQVTLTRWLYIMETEVTRLMWADLQAAQPTLPDDPSDTAISPTLNHPVQNNTWYEAVLFANLMSVRDGYTCCYYKDSILTVPVDASNYTTGYFYCDFNVNGYRLPTEAEWEYAARAGTTGPFSCSEPNYNSGNCASCTAGTHPTLEQYCVYCANDPGGTLIVGSKLANPWGLYDMHGNVWEWCWDWFDDYPSEPVTDPEGQSSGSFRVVRGGGWSGYALRCRSANRGSSNPVYRLSYQGFRLLRTTD